MAKKIVFCCDGTWNHPDETEDGLPANTNVYRFFKALKQTAAQAPHYDDGIGADGDPVDRLVEGAIGDGLFGKIKDAYTAIARSYQDGDGIFLFGFSRGAYTARSLAGMIAICGLPAPGKFIDQATEDAFNTYRNRANRSVLLPKFTTQYAAIDVKIAMLGVWDTVGALGFPGKAFSSVNSALYDFLDTSLHPDVLTAYHALAIDERRFEFAPTLWTLTPGSPPGQILEQVWFPGAHADVGGGYGRSGLADIALGWMMKKAEANGLEFDSTAFDKYTNRDPKRALDELHDPWSLIWGFPKMRQIDPGATIANSAVIRRQVLSGYAPGNIPSAPANTEPVIDPPPP